jgi:uncharacterized protein (TIGR02118 family)
MKDENRAKSTMSRRDVIAGAGTAASVAAVAGVAAATASAGAQGAESMVGQECMTIVYRNAPDARFDFDYYQSTHMPLIMRLYGDSISRFELRRGLPGADGAPPPYIATITIWIADPAAFDRAAAEHQAGIRADVTKFTNAELIAQRDRVVGIANS